MPIIKDIDKKNKNFEFLITTITLSSGNLATTEINNYNNIHHRFFPLDVTFNKRFLDKWSPNSVFCELGNLAKLYFANKKRGIPCNFKCRNNKKHIKVGFFQRQQKKFLTSLIYG